MVISLRSYYHDGKTLVDVHRCAPEGKFSIHSDIWAYGLLVWELFSRGLKPFKKLLEIQPGEDRRCYRKNARPNLVDHLGKNTDEHFFKSDNEPKH